MCPGCGARHSRDDNTAQNLRRQKPVPDLIQGLVADVEGTSDGRMAVVSGEMST